MIMTSPRNYTVNLSIFIASRRSQTVFMSIIILIIVQNPPREVVAEKEPRTQTPRKNAAQKGDSKSTSSQLKNDLDLEKTEEPHPYNIPKTKS